MSADDDGDGTGVAVTQDRVDVVERHAVHGGVVDFHDLVATPAEAPTGGRGQAHQGGAGTVAGPSCWAV